ncbi:MAG TPA: TonB family protein [Terriglobia bacterium]|nr:TonB family protein [Terriglobia bacterium]
MFEGTLLESSTEKAPTLKGIHWAISFGIGVAVFLTLYLLLPTISANETKVIVAQAAIVASVFTAFAVILCYVLADCKRHGFNRAVWFIVVLLLNLVGFIIYLMYSASKTGDWQRATLPIAYLFEAIIVGLLVLFPLIYTEALPKAQLMTFLAAPPPPPPPPPPPAAAPPPRIIHKVSAEDLMRAPTSIPKTIMKENQPEPVASVGVVGGVPGGVPGGQMGGVLGGVIGGVLSSVAAAPPPPPPPKPQAPKRVRVGGQVESAKLIFQPKPEYPPLAKMARIQGVVRLDAVISKDGTIQDLKVISGHPLLVRAALDAVQRWRYQPTLLNGEAVEVATEIDVNFTLSE